MPEMKPIPIAERPVKDGVTAYLNIDGVSDAAEFYMKAFAAEEMNRMPADDGKRLIHLCLKINNGYVMFSDPFPEHGHPAQTPQAFTLHLQVEDADAWFNRAVAAGAQVLMPLADMFWGDRYGQVRDRWGVNWSFGQALV
jgi:PhnB protein